MGQAIAYLDFDLVIRRLDGRYTAHVVSSPGGEATSKFESPFSDLELENFLLRIGRPRQGTRRLDSPEMDAAKKWGKRLFETIFADEIGNCWSNSKFVANEQKAGLRLRLRIVDAPELNDFPWEYLYDPSLDEFISLSSETPVTRYIELPSRIKPLAVGGPLRILVVISSPTDLGRLDVEHEWGNLNASLAQLVQSGKIEIERLAEARLPALQRKLRGSEYHILHFVGHGGFDSKRQTGLLVFQDGLGRASEIRPEQLGTLLHDHKSLRLVVLNACEGARSTRTDPFAGAAQILAASVPPLSG